MKTDLHLSYLYRVQHYTMNVKPISVPELDINKVTFTVSPSKVKNRGPSISLKYNGQYLSIRLPRVSFPAGVLVRDGEDGKTAYTLMASMKGCDPYGKERSTSTDEMGLFYNFLLDLEDKIVKEAIENSAAWFGKKKSEGVIHDNFKRVLGLSQDKVDGEYVANGKYPPSVRLKVPVYDNKVNMNVWDDSNKELHVTPGSLVSIFPKGVEAQVVVSGSIYVIGGGNFGVTWRLQMVKVFSRPQMTAQEIFGENVPVPDPVVAVVEEEVLEEESQVPDVVVTETPPAAPRKRRAAAVSSM